MSLRLHAGIDLTQLKHTWQGPWEAGKVYYLNDVVRYGSQSFVCVTTELGDLRKYGDRYRPTVANEYWQPFSNGMMVKGGWCRYEFYYPGDIVKYNDDWYLCKTYNKGAHPVYEYNDYLSRSLTTKWQKIASSSRTNKSSNYLQFLNQNPIGWEQNYSSGPGDFNNFKAQEYTAINGNYEPVVLGRGTTGYGMGQAVLPNAWATWGSIGFPHYDYIDGFRPTTNGGDPRCIQVVGGLYQKYFLFDSGEVFTYGYGAQSSNGDFSNTTRNQFTRPGEGPNNGGRGNGILRDVNIVKIATNISSDCTADEQSYSHVMALSEEGEVWVWGYNAYGQLGQGDVANYNYPVKIPKKFFDNQRIIDIWAAGTGSYSSSYALDENHNIWAWGYAGYGQLGIGEYYTNLAAANYIARPARVAADFNKYGGIRKWWNSGSSNTRLNSVLTNDGNIWHWGYSVYAAGWGYSQNDNYLNYPRRMQEYVKAQYENANAYERPQLEGLLNDVTENCEDMWVDGGSSLERIFMKEKGTGKLYVLGYNAIYANQMTYPTSGINNATYTRFGNNVANVTPSIMPMLDFKDVVHVTRTLTSTSSEYVFMNRDGRLGCVGNTTIQARGVGVNYSTAPFGRDLALDPERNLTRSMESVTQVRWNEPFQDVKGHSDGGFLGITKNNRMVYCGVINTTYGFTPYAQLVAQGGTGAYVPVRTLT